LRGGVNRAQRAINRSIAGIRRLRISLAHEPLSRINLQNKYREAKQYQEFHLINRPLTIRTIPTLNVQSQALTQRVIWRCWQNRAAYDEKIYEAALRKSNSPIVPRLESIA
jgi:hypothetical protein